MAENALTKIFDKVGSKLTSLVSGSGTPVVDVDKNTMDKTRGINANGTKTSGVEAKTTEVNLPKNQPATTPQSGVSVNAGEVDAYRYGADGVSSPDNLSHPRTLGEPEQDSIAYLSISTEVQGDLGSYYSNALKSLKTRQKNGDPTALGQNAVVQGNVITAYSRFFLQGVSENQAEKYQIVETFTSFYTFFYGKRPTVYSFAGTLLNDENHKWVNDFMFFYENFFRGSRTADVGAQAVMTYDGRVVSGFILDITIQQNADMNKGAQFSMNMLVTEHVPVQFSADITSLIEQAQADLISQAARISQQISTINRNVPAEVAKVASDTTSGKRPGARVKQPGSKDKGTLANKSHKGLPGAKT